MLTHIRGIPTNLLEMDDARGKPMDWIQHILNDQYHSNNSNIPMMIIYVDPLSPIPIIQYFCSLQNWVSPVYYLSLHYNFEVRKNPLPHLHPFASNYSHIPPLKFNIKPENIPTPNRKGLSSNPPFFRGKLAVELQGCPIFTQSKPGHYKRHSGYPRAPQVFEPGE